MKILVAPDKFKGSLTAQKVCSAVREGLLQHIKDDSIILLPLADGGEGTCGLLTDLFSGSSVTVTVNGPLFTPVQATYGIGGTTAWIEMADASGLQLVEPGERNPLYTTTYGTGELILHAMLRGVKEVVLGIGGSATNDAGIGMAAALGFGFYDRHGQPLKPIGKNLIELQSIRADGVHPSLKQVRFTTLFDVRNPLYGPEGAAFVYAPQKGADEKTVKLLDDGLRHFERITRQYSDIPVNFEGAGAAGGLGAASRLFLNASLRQGIDYIIENTNLEEKVKAADIVITGEGKLDRQSLSGKVVMAVSRMAGHYKKPVIVVCGKCEVPLPALQQNGIARVIELATDGIDTSAAMGDAYNILKKRVAAHSWHDDYVQPHG